MRASGKFKELFSLPAGLRTIAVAGFGVLGVGSETKLLVGIKEPALAGLSVRAWSGRVASTFNLCLKWVVAALLGLVYSSTGGILIGSGFLFSPICSITGEFEEESGLGDTSLLAFVSVVPRRTSSEYLKSCCMVVSMLNGPVLDEHQSKSRSISFLPRIFTPPLGRFFNTMPPICTRTSFFTK